eukprot:ctg_603.g271
MFGGGYGGVHAGGTEGGTAAHAAGRLDGAVAPAATAATLARLHFATANTLSGVHGGSGEEADVLDVVGRVPGVIGGAAILCVVHPELGLAGVCAADGVAVAHRTHVGVWGFRCGRPVYVQPVSRRVVREQHLGGGDGGHLRGLFLRLVQGAGRAPGGTRGSALDAGQNHQDQLRGWECSARECGTDVGEGQSRTQGATAMRWRSLGQLQKERGGDAGAFDLMATVAIIGHA